jgi:hypothetical protein
MDIFPVTGLETSVDDPLTLFVIRVDMNGLFVEDDAAFHNFRGANGGIHPGTPVIYSTEDSAAGKV